MKRSCALVALVLVVSAGCASESGDADGDGAEPKAPVTVAFEDALQSEISMDHPDWPLNARGSIWINRETGQIEQIDPQRERIESTIEMHGYPCQNIVRAAADLWTIDCESSELVRIGPVKGKVEARIPIEGLPRQTFGSIAVADRQVWVQASGEGGYYLVSVDPKTNDAAQPVFIGKEAAGMVGSGDHLWISNPFEGIVYKFDASTRTVVESIEGLSGPRWIAVASGSVWVLNEDDGTVTRIDEESAQIEEMIDVGDRGPSSYIVAALGAVWARPAGKLYVRIDPETNAVTHEMKSEFGVGGLALGFGSIWATGLEEGRLWRLSLP